MSRPDEPTAQPSSPAGIITAIALLLVYQGYSLSIVGVASPWIAKSFALDQRGLARLFAWMSLSAFAVMILSRLADRVGRRLVILLALVLVPVFSVGAAIASDVVTFAASQILISALLGGSVSSAIVLLAEELPDNRRASGQAYAAFASAVGGVIGYIVIPFLLAAGYSWRWLLAPCTLGLALVVPVARMLPVDSRWSRTVKSEAIAGTRIYDIFHPLYRRRALALLACAALDTMAGTAVNGWLYFAAVSVIGLPPRTASTLVVAGMGLGMLGFPLGAWAAERFGRVPTVAYVGGAAWFGALGFYWVPALKPVQPLPFLLGAYGWFKIASGMMTVGANAATTEVLPAALRTTMIGWQGITAAVFSVLAQTLIASLVGPLGGLLLVIRCFALLGIPSAIVFALFIDETRGISLDEAAKEDQWQKTAHHPTGRLTVARQAQRRTDS